MDCRCTQEERIRSLETGQAETKVYVKQILDDIQEIKNALKELNTKPDNKLWQPIIIELIKLSALCVTILGAVVGAVKILGK